MTASRIEPGEIQAEIALAGREEQAASLLEDLAHLGSSTAAQDALRS